ncbi:MAG: 3-oxoacyl-[acyl-carrier-protein] reductase [Planctomycetota bacterium]
MTRLAQKVAVVTGAARGIGQCIALKLAREGADLALCDLQVDWLAETAQKARDLGRRVECYAINVGEAESVDAGMKAVVKDFGSLDVLVHNAGITKDGLLMRMSEADWDAVLSVNLRGSFLCTKAVIRQMMKQRSGSIVNIASVIGLMGNAGQANYAASKAGLIALTKSTAKEVAARGVRANAVAPGYIDTKMTESLPDEVKQQMIGLIPLGRMGDPEEVAKAVAFLASDEASYITGQTIPVCGGMVMD